MSETKFNCFTRYHKKNRKERVNNLYIKERKKRTEVALKSLCIGLVLGTSGLGLETVKAGSVSYVPEVKAPVVHKSERSENVISSVENIDTRHYSSASYGYKQCTWWAYNRARDFGISYGEYMGNGAEWKNQSDYSVSSTPVLHSVISFEAGQTLQNGLWWADPTYGHVAFVEAVYADGSVLVSESGTNLESEYSTQLISASDALQLHYVIGHEL